MDNDYSPFVTSLGVGAIILFILFYAGTIALTLWIGYLIIRSAVKNGILRADEERARRGLPQSPV